MNSRVEEILKKHITTINSFLDENGHNRFTECVEALEQAQRDAVGGLRVRQISGFQRDELGRWYKRYPTGMVLVTDEMLLDALNVRQENIDLINEYLNQTNLNPKEGE